MKEQSQKAQQAAQTPLEDLRRSALEHYEKVTTIAHEWYSDIPKAINAYFDNLVKTDHLIASAEDGPQLTEEECQLVIGAISLQALPSVAPATTASNSARRAAEGVAEIVIEDVDLKRLQSVAFKQRIVNVVAKYLATDAAAPADNDAESLLQHVAYSGVEFDDNRMGYVVVQIDRDVWEQIQKLAPTTKGDR